MKLNVGAPTPQQAMEQPDRQVLIAFGKNNWLTWVVVGFSNEEGGICCRDCREGMNVCDRLDVLYWGVLPDDIKELES